MPEPEQGDSLPEDLLPDDLLPDDLLPEDLDVTAYVGPYLFPDVRRRRIAGALHGIVAIGCLIAGVTSGNVGLLGASALLGLIAAYHTTAAYHLALDQT